MFISKNYLNSWLGEKKCNVYLFFYCLFIIFLKWKAINKETIKDKSKV